ncbi:hypothetical protein CBL_05505 [Carabus blaptoides fortunei]
MRVDDWLLFSFSLGNISTVDIRRGVATFGTAILIQSQTKRQVTVRAESLKSATDAGGKHITQRIPTPDHHLLTCYPSRLDDLSSDGFKVAFVVLTDLGNKIVYS